MRNKSSNQGGQNKGNIQFYIDAESVFIACSEHIPKMKKIINKILVDMVN